jgi:hypothetical protein
MGRRATESRSDVRRKEVTLMQEVESYHPQFWEVTQRYAAEVIELSEIEA